MNYVESRHIPKDIWYMIGKYLSLDNILLLQQTTNTMFNADSLIYEEYFKHHIDDCVCINYLEKLRSIKGEIQSLKDEELMEYCCVHGYLMLLIPLLQTGILSKTKTIVVKKMHPMKKRLTPLVTATRHGHLKIVKYLIENYEKECLMMTAQCYRLAQDKYPEISEYLYSYAMEKKV